MLMKYRDGVIPASSAQTSLDKGGQEALREYSRAMDALDLRGGAEAAWTLVSAANLFVQQSAPWTLAKVGKDAELDEVLSALARALCRLALMTSPFIPGKAQTVWEDLGMEAAAARSEWSAAEDPPVAGRTARKQSILFPKPVKV
jgi:methionyl-tRNA synthetase